MQHTMLHITRETIGGIVLAACLLCTFTAARSESTKGSASSPPGRINFEDAKLPPADVEVDLSQGMFKDLFGIGDAAAAGVAETLSKWADGNKAEAVHRAADQLEAAKQIVQIASNVVREVRVRVYEKMTDDLSSRFEQQVRADDWERIVVVRKGQENARVFVARGDDSIRGIFVIAGDRGEQVLVNVVCDISPENVKKLTSAATKIGLENGLGRVIELKMDKMKRMPGVEQRHAIVLKNGDAVISSVIAAPPKAPVPPALATPPPKR